MTGRKRLATFGEYTAYAGAIDRADAPAYLVRATTPSVTLAMGSDFEARTWGAYLDANPVAVAELMGAARDAGILA